MNSDAASGAGWVNKIAVARNLAAYRRGCLVGVAIDLIVNLTSAEAISLSNGFYEILHTARTGLVFGSYNSRFIDFQFEQYKQHST